MVTPGKIYKKIDNSLSIVYTTLNICIKPKILYSQATKLCYFSNPTGENISSRNEIRNFNQS